MSTVVPGGWPPSPANDPGLRKVMPLSYIVYNDPYDQKYHADANGTLGTSGIDSVNSDAATVIQNAVSAIIANGGGDLVIKGPTTYSISRKITVNGNHVHIQGRGYPVLSLNNGVNDEMLQIGDGTHNYSDVYLDRLELNGNYLNNSTTTNALVDFNGPPNNVNAIPHKNMQVSNCIIHDGHDRGLYFFATADSRVHGNTFYNNNHAFDANSSFTNSAIESSGNMVLYNTVRNQRGDGLITSLMQQSVYGYNNIYSNGGIGLSIDSAFQSVFIGNQIYSNNEGIVVFSSIALGPYYVELTDNIIYFNNQNGIRLTTQPSYTIIKGNILRSNSQQTGGAYDEIQTAGTKTLIEVNFIKSDTTTRSRYNINELTGSNNELIQGNFLDGGGTGLLVVIGNANNKIGRNIGYVPSGNGSACDNTNHLISALAGVASNPVASTDYMADLCDQIIYVTGGTGVSIVLKDNAGNVFSAGLTTPQTLYLPHKSKINFGAFSGAPTVSGYAVV